MPTEALIIAGQNQFPARPTLNAPLRTVWHIAAHTASAKTHVFTARGGGARNPSHSHPPGPSLCSTLHSRPTLPRSPLKPRAQPLTLSPSWPQHVQHSTAAAVWMHGFRARLLARCWPIAVYLGYSRGRKRVHCCGEHSCSGCCGYRARM